MQHFPNFQFSKPMFSMNCTNSTEYLCLCHRGWRTIERRFLCNWLIEKKNALCYYCFLMKILWNSWLYYSMEYCKIFMKFKVPPVSIMKFPQFYYAIRNLAIFCSLIFISHCSFVSLMIFFCVLFIDFYWLFWMVFGTFPSKSASNQE